MRRVVYLASLAFALLAVSGCETEQPSTVENQALTVSFKAHNSKVPEYNVWDLTEDSDLDGVPDDVNGDGTTGDKTLFCRCTMVSSQGKCNTPTIPDSVPWNYAVRISVVRDGEILVDSETGQLVREQLTSDEAAGDRFNRAAYDSNQPTHFDALPSINVNHRRGRCSTKNAIKCNPDSVTPRMTTSWCGSNNGGVCQAVFNCSGDFDTLCGVSMPATDCAALGLGDCVNPIVQRRFDFSAANRRRLSAANRELLNAADSFIYNTCVGDDPCIAQVEGNLGALVPELGNCPGQDLGDPKLDPLTADANRDATIFGFTLNKGDTVFVEARRSDQVPGGNEVFEFFEPAGIRATFTVDGATLQESEVQGTLTSTSGEPSPNLSFSFTSK